MFAPEEAEAGNGRFVIAWFRDPRADDLRQLFLWRCLLRSGVGFVRHIRLVPLH
ncbi:hypothetical protein D3C73_1381530 [compost metagenome]